MSYNYGDNNPFYNKCHDSVFNEIESRAKKYGSVERGGTNGKPIHEWLYGKTGYVLIKYLNGNDYNTILEPPRAGFDSLYGSDYFPPPVVNSVRISNEGDYGSLMKADINFTVFTIGELEKFTNTLLAVLPGEGNKNPPVKIEWEWSQGGNGGTEQFYGYVTNFDWSLRPDGGFDCVSHLIGEGFFSLGTNATNTVSADTNTKTGNDDSPVTDWVNLITKIKWTDYAISGVGKYKLPSGNPIGIKQQLKVRNNPNDDKDTTTKDDEIRYVTLEFACFCKIGRASCRERVLRLV